MLASLTGFTGVIGKVSEYWLYEAVENLGVFIPIEVPDNLQPVEVAPWEWTLAIALILLIIGLVVWMVALMYHGYRISANLKGTRAGVSFAIGLFLAQIITNIVSYQLIRAWL